MAGGDEGGEAGGEDVGAGSAAVAAFAIDGLAGGFARVACGLGGVGAARAADVG